MWIGCTKCDPGEQLEKIQSVQYKDGIYLNNIYIFKCCNTLVVPFLREFEEAFKAVLDNKEVPSSLCWKYNKIDNFHHFTYKGLK